MSYTAFNHFLKGGKPQAETLKRLVHWYVASKEGETTVRREDVSVAIELLRAYVAEAGTPRAMRLRLEAINSELATGKP